MKVEKQSDGTYLLEFTAKEAHAIDEDIAKYTGHDMPTQALNLSSTLRAAWYEANDEFRQPPNAWEPGARFPTMD